MVIQLGILRPYRWRMVDEERDIHWLAPDPRAPLTLDKRAQLSVDEVKELARRQGVAIPG